MLTKAIRKVSRLTMSFSLVCSGILDAQDSDFPVVTTTPSRRHEIGRHRDFLQVVHRIGDHAAADPSTDLLTPTDVHHFRHPAHKIGTDVAKKHEASSRRRHAAHEMGRVTRCDSATKQYMERRRPLCPTCNGCRAWSRSSPRASRCRGSTPLTLLVLPWLRRRS